MLQKVIKYIKSPKIILDIFLVRLGNKISDKMYLKVFFYLRMNKKLDLKKTKTFNEKLQWLKLYNRVSLYTTMVDKYLVKEYVSQKIGKKYIIPTIGVWDDINEIDFTKLPDSFVMKCTHDSGGLVICKDKSKLDFNNARKKIRNSLNRNYHYLGREWPYKDVKPRIIVEKFMTEEGGADLKDYKIFCFNGEPKIIQVDYDRFTNHKRNIYDTNWNLLDFCLVYPNNREKVINKPQKLEKMIDLAKKLSIDIPFLRVDFYVINEKLFFGEMTFFPETGTGKITPPQWDYKLGEMLKLPVNKKE